MFRKPTGSKPDPRASSTTARVETQPTTATAIPPGADRSPSPEQIAIDAYHRWLTRGQPLGNDWEDWFEAERRLSATA